MDTPIVFIIFRRPEKTRQVFRAIQEAKPSKLFIVADGPHSGNLEEEKYCEKTRAVVKDISWDCEVYRNYADENMGCGVRPATGITWAFEHVDRAIILEDDCLPDSSFFPFCHELLEYYSDTPQVMHINGNTYGLEQRDWNDYSYGFCNYPQAWGWATWRDAWKKFEFGIPKWPAFKSAGMLKDLHGGEQCVRERIRKWDRVYDGQDPDIWDYQWHFEVMRRSGLTVVPEVNLVSNIGFGEGATHTVHEGGSKDGIPTDEIGFPLSHPPYTLADSRINEVYKNSMVSMGLVNKIKKKLGQLFQFL